MTIETNAKPTSLRWRVHKGQLTLRRRHLRALAALELPQPLMAWIHERLEWAVANMMSSSTQAVLVVNLDAANDGSTSRAATEQQVTISVEDLIPAPQLDCDNLIIKDGLIVGVQLNGACLPGTVWLEKSDCLIACAKTLIAATDTLVADLASTLNISAIIEQQAFDTEKTKAAFLISDEFGFLPIWTNPKQEAPLSQKMQECFARLWQLEG